MNIGFKNVQDTGKTSLAVQFILYLTQFCGYEAIECWGNVDIYIPGFHYVPDDKVLDRLLMMIEHKERHVIGLIDEADGIIPARGFTDKKQWEKLLGLWKDVKRFNFLLWTAHLGGGVDLILRQVSQVTVIPKYIKVPGDVPPGWIAKPGDTVAKWIDNAHMTSCKVTFPNVKAVFPFYPRWD